MGGLVLCTAAAEERQTMMSWILFVNLEEYLALASIGHVGDVVMGGVGVGSALACVLRSSRVLFGPLPRAQASTLPPRRPPRPHSCPSSTSSGKADVASAAGPCACGGATSRWRLPRSTAPSMALRTPSVQRAATTTRGAAATTTTTTTATVREALAPRGPHRRCRPPSRAWSRPSSAPRRLARPWAIACSTKRSWPCIARSAPRTLRRPCSPSSPRAQARGGGAVLPTARRAQLGGPWTAPRAVAPLAATPLAAGVVEAEAEVVAAWGRIERRSWVWARSAGLWRRRSCCTLTTSPGGGTSTVARCRASSAMLVSSLRRAPFTSRSFLTSSACVKGVGQPWLASNSTRTWVDRPMRDAPFLSFLVVSLAFSLSLSLSYSPARQLLVARLGPGDGWLDAELVRQGLTGARLKLARLQVALVHAVGSVAAAPAPASHGPGSIRLGGGGGGRGGALVEPAALVDDAAAEHLEVVRRRGKRGGQSGRCSGCRTEKEAAAPAPRQSSRSTLPCWSRLPSFDAAFLLISLTLARLLCSPCRLWTRRWCRRPSRSAATRWWCGRAECLPPAAASRAVSRAVSPMAKASPSLPPPSRPSIRPSAHSPPRQLPRCPPCPPRRGTWCEASLIPRAAARTGTTLRRAKAAGSRPHATALLRLRARRRTSPPQPYAARAPSALRRPCRPRRGPCRRPHAQGAGESHR